MWCLYIRSQIEINESQLHVIEWILWWTWLHKRKTKFIFSVQKSSWKFKPSICRAVDQKHRTHDVYERRGFFICVVQYTTARLLKCWRKIPQMFFNVRLNSIYTEVSTEDFPEVFHWRSSQRKSIQKVERKSPQKSPKSVWKQFFI